MTCIECGGLVDEVERDSIDVTRGPDLAYPPRWKPDVFRVMAPGITTAHPCGHHQGVLVTDESAQRPSTT